MGLLFLRYSCGSVFLVHQFGFVRIFPDLDEDDWRVEPEKDAERQGDALNDRPGVKSEESQLYGWVLDFLNFEGVDDPHGEVANEEECDNLSTRLWVVVVGGVDPPPLGIGDEEELQHHLNDGDGTGGEHQQIPQIVVRS